MKQKLKEIRTSPYEGDRLLEGTLKQNKSMYLFLINLYQERAINRTVKISSEIRQSSEWTMKKVLETVIDEKRRKREELIKEMERKKEEEELRHQLETQSVVSSLSKWLTKKASQMISEKKDQQNTKLHKLKSILGSNH